eukprot:11910969-Ditylum_brightwellii.AAC.1
MSKTTSEAMQNLVGAGEDPNGRRSRATAMLPMMAVQAAAIAPHVCRRRYALSMLHLCMRMGVEGW